VSLLRGYLRLTGKARRTEQLNQGIDLAMAQVDRGKSLSPDQSRRRLQAFIKMVRHNQRLGLYDTKEASPADSDNRKEMTSLRAELDPLADAIARGAAGKEDVLKRAGGALSAAQVAPLLGLTAPAIRKRRSDGRLLAVRRADNYLYPACQFGTDDVLSGLEDVLEEMIVRNETANTRPWSALQFLVTEDDQLGGLSPVVKKRDAMLTERVKRLARASVSDGFG
jgi:hypothetical protein